MQQVFRVAVLGSLVLLAAPTQAQQFSFMTGDRAMQGYAPRATNDGYQAGGGTPGQAPDTSYSPYQSGLAASTGPGQQASTGSGIDAGGSTGSGGTGVTLYAPPGGGGAAGMAGALGTNTSRQDARTLTGFNPPSGGKQVDVAGVMKASDKSTSQGGGGAAGPNVAIAGDMPKGFTPPATITGASGGATANNCPFCGAAARAVGSGATLVPADVPRGNVALSSDGLAKGTNAYMFKFNAPQTQAFANLAPAPAPPGPPPIQIPVTTLTSVNQMNTATRATIAGSAAGQNSGLGAGTNLKSLTGVSSVQKLAIPNVRQKP